MVVRECVSAYLTARPGASEIENQKWMTMNNGPRPSMTLSWLVTFSKGVGLPKKKSSLPLV